MAFGEDEFAGVGVRPPMHTEDLLLSGIWVVALQNFAQKHSKSDMLFLILYCLIEPFGSACAAVLRTLYLCVWVIFSTGGLVVLSEVMFFIFWGKEIYFQFYVIMQNFLYQLSFFCLHLLGVLFFVCFVCFLQCCISQSMLGAKCSLCVMFCGQLFYSELKGGWEGGKGVCMALSLSVYCTFLSFDISIAKPIVFFKLHFDFDISNISYIITVFSFQCNAFLRHSHPPT